MKSRSSAGASSSGLVGRLLGEADALAASGQLQAALAAYDRVLAAYPGALAALRSRGDMLVRLGRPAEALASFEQSLQHAPADVWLLHSRGVLLGQFGRTAEALASYDRALKIQPGYVPALFSRAVTLMNAGRLDEAVAAYAAALKREPRHIPSLANRGICLQRLGRNEEAVASFDAVLKLEPRNPVALNSRGLALQALMRGGEALASFDAAIAAAPGVAEAHGNRGILLNQLGRRDEAEAALERAVRLAPDQARLYHHFAAVRRFKAGDPHIAAMQGLARHAATLPVEAQVELRFALGKALNDIGDHAGAFAHLKLANDLKRRTFSYDEAAILGEFDRIAAALDRDFMRRTEGLGEADASPVLIVGMPRSGSTLIEQILATHRSVAGMREPMALSQAIGSKVEWPPTLKSSPDYFSTLAEDYLSRIRRAGWKRSRRFVDKFPMNYFYIGAIALAFPKAIILHSVREPMDTCFSWFRYVYDDGNEFSYDLAQSGRAYVRYREMMDHWAEVLPGRVIDVSHEDLVADPEAKIRELITQSCRLEWDENCLKFYENDRLVRTASKFQVRQPIFTSSIGRWKRYERHLGPLIEALGPYGPSGA